MKTTLTAFVPAHKQTNPQHAPGQVVNPLGFVDKTLGDYIRRKEGIGKAFEAVKKECCGRCRRRGPTGRERENCPPPEKLTFEEWFEQSGWAAWANGRTDCSFPYSALQAAFSAGDK